MQIGSVETFILYCTGQCTLPHGFKTALGYLFLRMSWCPVAWYHKKKIIFEIFFYLSIAEIDTAPAAILSQKHNFHDKSLFNKLMQLETV